MRFKSLDWLRYFFILLSKERKMEDTDFKIQQVILPLREGHVKKKPGARFNERQVAYLAIS